MIVYNVTTKVTPAIEKDWLQWIKEIHIPEVLQTKCFTSASFLQLLETDDTEGRTFVVQYFAESKSIYNNYIEKFAPLMRQKCIDKWGNQFIAFRSVMEQINY